MDNRRGADDVRAPEGAGPGLTASTVVHPRLRSRPRRTVWRLVALLCIALAGSTAGQIPAWSDTPEERSTGTALVPRHQVLRRTLRADSRQEYFLYVPSGAGRGAPILVDTHGISRNVEEHATLLAPFAEKHQVVLISPYFPEEQFNDYQRLGGRTGRRADLAVMAIVKEVGELTGAATEKFSVFGFSGGAQFAHRFAMAYPERVAAAAIGAAGWYLFPDKATPYPYGLGPGEGAELSEVHFDPDKFLRVPMTVFVGTADTGSNNVRHNPTVDRQQGMTRLERARRWTEAMRRAAVARGLEPLVSCETVPGIAHSFSQFMQEGDLGDRVFGALFAEHGASATGAGAAR